MSENNSDLIAQVTALASLAAYQPHSVVSREVIKRASGTVSVFAFDKGEGLSEHTASFDAVVYILEGQAEVIIGGKPLQLKSGEMTIMPGGTPHALNATTSFKMLLILIK